MPTEIRNSPINKTLTFDGTILVIAEHINENEQFNISFKSG